MNVRKTYLFEIHVPIKRALPARATRSLSLIIDLNCIHQGTAEELANSSTMSTFSAILTAMALKAYPAFAFARPRTPFRTSASIARQLAPGGDLIDCGISQSLANEAVAWAAVKGLQMAKPEDPDAPDGGVSRIALV